MSEPTPPIDSPPIATELGYESATVQHTPLAVVLGLVGLRLLGLYFVFVSIATLPTAVFYIMQMYSFGPTSGSSYMWLGYAGSGLITLAFGLILFFRSPRWARSLFGQLRDDGHGITASELLTILIATVGLWLLASSLETVFSTLANVLTVEIRRPSANTYASTALMDQSAFFGLLIVLIQPAVGIALMIYASRIARVGIRKLGYA